MGMVKKVFFKDPRIGAETSTGLTSMAATNGTQICFPQGSQGFDKGIA